MMPGPDFEYSNLSGRPPGPVLRALSHLLRGVRDVQNQVEPYAARWGQANLSALAADGPLWVALGDSMTQGVGASDYDRGWVGQLQTSGGSEIPGRLINLASSGARVGDVLDRQLPALAALGRRPELVTVLIGSNDLIRPRHRKAFPLHSGDCWQNCREVRWSRPCPIRPGQQPWPTLSLLQRSAIPAW